MLEKVERSSKINILEKLAPILVVLSVVLAFVVGVLWQKVSSLEKGGSVQETPSAAAQPTQPKADLNAIKDLFGKDVIKFGDAKRKILFVEIGDPSCPFCQAAGGQNHKIYSSLGGTAFQLVADGGAYIAPVTEMKKLVDDGKASFAYIYYPGHGTGEMGMKSLYCANEKGKFWQAHDLIMSDAGYTLMNTTVKNDKTQSQTVADFLKNAVDPDFLKSCLDSGKYDAQLTNDQAIAVSLGVQGTPGFFINDQSFPGAFSWTDMKGAVDAALK